MRVMGVKFTKEQIIKKVQSELPDVLELIDCSNVKDIRSMVIVKCKNCQRIKELQVFSILYGKVGCPACKNSTAIKGINDIATTDPWMIEYLANKDDAYKYKAQSNFKIDVKCPDCGHIKQIQISQLHNRRWSCPCCSDGVSYPNKLSRGLLKQLPIQNLQFEYCPEWLKPYKYDNYFEYNNQKYVLEMDGGLGHGHSDYKHKQDIKGLEIDKCKDNLAKDHNIKVIRIDCINSDFDYIKSNIEKSEISKIFNLSKVDWVKCEEFAVTSYVKMICDYYMNNEDVSTTDIQKEFKIGNSTAKRYLLQGARLGLCDYTVEKGKQLAVQKNKNIKQDRTPKITKIYNGDMNLIGEFAHLTQAVTYLNRIYSNIEFNCKSIQSKLDKNNDNITYKGFYIQRIKKGSVLNECKLL